MQFQETGQPPATHCCFRQVASVRLQATWVKEIQCTSCRPLTWRCIHSAFGDRNLVHFRANLEKRSFLTYLPKATASSSSHAAPPFFFSFFTFSESCRPLESRLEAQTDTLISWSLLTLHASVLKRYGAHTSPDSNAASDAVGLG